MSNHAPVDQKMKNFVKGIKLSLAKKTTSPRKGNANSHIANDIRSLSVNSNKKK